MGKLGLFIAMGVAMAILYGSYCLVSRAMDSSSALVQIGTASWYGREEQGKRTADGEIFDRHEYTAASRHLPFNTVVRVTNEANGRSVRVRINDRGPFAKNRILDLSEAAADDLDMRRSGTAKVRIQVLGGAESEASTAP